MRKLWLSALLVLALVSLGLTKERRCTLRVHTEANARDGATFASEMPAQFFGRQVVLARTPVLSENDVVAFRAYRKADGRFGALLQLDDHGQLALDTLSMEQRGRSLFVFLNGRPLTELQIDKRVSDGRLYLPGGLSAADIQLMEKRWPLLGKHRK